MKFSKPFVLVFLILIPFIIPCPLPDTSENLNKQTEPDAITDPDVPGDTTPATGPLAGYSLSLKEYDFWTFFRDWSDKATWTSSYDSGTDNEAASGYLTVTLGGSTVIGGKTMFQVILSGDIPSRFATKPFWTYLGSDNGSLIGSNGVTVYSIINGIDSSVRHGLSTMQTI